MGTASSSRHRHFQKLAKIRKRTIEHWASKASTLSQRPEPFASIDLDALQTTLSVFDLAKPPGVNGTMMALLQREAGADPEEIALPRLQDMDEPTLCMVRDLTSELEMAYSYIQTLARDAYFDPLTNLFNRRAMLYNFNRTVIEMKSAPIIHQREEDHKREEAVEKGKVFTSTPFVPEQVSMALFDLNDLHILNRRHGFDAGDVIIQHVARILKEQLPQKPGGTKTSMVHRLGGDEFVVILRDTSPAEAESYVGRVMAEVEMQALKPPADSKRTDWAQVPKSMIGVHCGLNPPDKLRDVITKLDRRLTRLKTGKAAAESQNTMAWRAGQDFNADTGSFEPPAEPGSTIIEPKPQGPKDGSGYRGTTPWAQRPGNTPRKGLPPGNGGQGRDGTS